MFLLTQDRRVARWSVRRAPGGRLVHSPTDWLNDEEADREPARVVCTDAEGYTLSLTGEQWRYVEASGLTDSFYHAVLSGDRRRAHCITCSYPSR
jgi:hypothetical protein